MQVELLERQDGDHRPFGRGGGRGDECRGREGRLRPASLLVQAMTGQHAEQPPAGAAGPRRCWWRSKP